MNNSKSYFPALVLAGVLSLGTVQVSMAQSILLDGTFTGIETTAGVADPTSPGGQLSTTTTTNNVLLADWTTTGYTFVFGSGNPGDVNVAQDGGTFSLWGPANGSSNGMVLPPYGGNVVASDGVYETGPIYQTLTGLTTGQVYLVSFEWAGAQQSTYTGATTEGWSVALGGTGYSGGVLAGAQNTTMVANVTEGFTGWMAQTFDFTATSSSEILYFLADGTPAGEPPISLLADVSVVAVPEPAATAGWMILIVLLIVGGKWLRQRGQKGLPATT